MSLVHEALQKAEREKQRKTSVAPTAIPVTQPVSLPAPVTQPVIPVRNITTPASQPITGKSSSMFLTALIAFVAIVALVAIVFLVKSATSTIRESQRVIQQTPAPAAKAEIPETTTARPPVTENVPAPATTDARWKLTGIMNTPEGNYAAVLNGKVVYETHYVDGAIVKKIERDRVTLDVNGKETVVRLF